jgi:sugar diacid utilization regulator
MIMAVMNMRGIPASLKRVAEIIKKDVDIINPDGYVVHSSNQDRMGNILSREGFERSLLLDSRHGLYVCIEYGSDEEISLIQMILKDKMFEAAPDSYQQFFINLLETNEVPEDFERYGIHDQDSFVVYCISIPSREHLGDAYSLMANSFYDEGCRWVFPYRGDIILVEKLEDFSESVRQNAKTIKDMINSEIFAGISIGVGNLHKGIEGIRKSFGESIEAIRIGRMFNLPDDIFIYGDLLAERIVDMIPQDKAEEFFNGIFNEDIGETLDGEMIKTIDVLFKNNLNISDSSRILYIHRNTLLYRIDKIQKATGLDLRRFEDAVQLKLVYLLKQRRKL